jgi:hypothetical protein
LNHCVLSDADGRYTLSLEPGSYQLEAEGVGYGHFQQTVVVNAGQAIEFDVVLSARQSSGQSYSSGRDLMEAVIEAGILTNTIAGRLDVAVNDDCFFSTYDEGFSAWMLHQTPGNLSFLVSATNRSGAVFVARLVSRDELEGVRLWVDSTVVNEIGLGDILQYHGDDPAYATSIEKQDGETVVYCLVYLPHWSSHTIQIQSLANMVSSGPVLAFYLVIAVLVGVCVVLPIVAIERKRR